MFELITLTSGEMTATRGLRFLFIFSAETTDRLETERQMEDNGEGGVKRGSACLSMNYHCFTLSHMMTKVEADAIKEGKRQTEGGTGAMLLERSYVAEADLEIKRSACSEMH